MAMHRNAEKTRKNGMAGNLLFLLLAFPFGLLYFLLVVIGFSVGLGTLVVWVGIPILIATIALIHGMAAVERSLVTHLLGIDIPRPIGRIDQERQPFMKRFMRTLRDPLTWTSTIYMLVKFPLGIFSFTIALVLPIVAFSVTLLPLVYLVNLFVNAILLANGIQSSSILIPYFLEIHGQFDLTMFVRSFVGVPVGLVLWFVTRYVINGLAVLSGELARALLSPYRTSIAEPRYPQYQASAEPQPKDESYAYGYQEVQSR